MWEFNLPRLDLQEGSPELQQVKSYLFQLTDQLKYLFSAVDVENLAPDLYQAYQNSMSLPTQVTSLQENMEQEFAKFHNAITPEVIPNGADLDDYGAPGVYCQPIAGQTSNMSNIPENRGFWMWSFRDKSGSYGFQIIDHYAIHKIYQRALVGGTWYSWTLISA